MIGVKFNPVVPFDADGLTLDIEVNGWNLVILMRCTFGVHGMQRFASH